MVHAKYLSSSSLGFLKENILSFSFQLPWQAEFCMESNSLNNFLRWPLKEHLNEIG
jgi:hypothetical protein